jgi:hypothetical protein
MVKEWTPVEVATQIASVGEAFKTWIIIRDEAVAQAYLVSLLGAKERRPTEPKLQKARTERKKKRPNPDTPPTGLAARGSSDHFQAAARFHGE